MLSLRSTPSVATSLRPPLSRWIGLLRQISLIEPGPPSQGKARLNGRPFSGRPLHPGLFLANVCLRGVTSRAYDKPAQTFRPNWASYEPIVTSEWVSPKFSTDDVFDHVAAASQHASVGDVTGPTTPSKAHGDAARRAQSRQASQRALEELQLLLAEAREQLAPRDQADISHVTSLEFDPSSSPNRRDVTRHVAQRLQALSHSLDAPSLVSFVQSAAAVDATWLQDASPRGLRDVILRSALEIEFERDLLSFDLFVQALCHLGPDPDPKVKVPSWPAPRKKKTHWKDILAARGIFYGDGGLRHDESRTVGYERAEVKLTVEVGSVKALLRKNMWHFKKMSLASVVAVLKLLADFETADGKVLHNASLAALRKLEQKLLLSPDELLDLLESYLRLNYRRLDVIHMALQVHSVIFSTFSPDHLGRVLRVMAVFYVRRRPEFQELIKVVLQKAGAPRNAQEKVQMKLQPSVQEDTSAGTDTGSLERSGEPSADAHTEANAPPGVAVTRPVQPVAAECVDQEGHVFGPRDVANVLVACAELYRSVDRSDVIEALLVSRASTLPELANRNVPTGRGANGASPFADFDLPSIVDVLWSLTMLGHEGDSLYAALINAGLKRVQSISREQASEPSGEASPEASAETASHERADEGTPQVAGRLIWAFSFRGVRSDSSNALVLGLLEVLKAQARCHVNLHTKRPSEGSHEPSTTQKHSDAALLEGPGEGARSAERSDLGSSGPDPVPILADPPIRTDPQPHLNVQAKLQSAPLSFPYTLWDPVSIAHTLLGLATMRLEDQDTLSALALLARAKRFHFDLPSLCDALWALAVFHVFDYGMLWALVKTWGPLVDESPDIQMSKREQMCRRVSAFLLAARLEAPGVYSQLQAVETFCQDLEKIQGVAIASFRPSYRAKLLDGVAASLQGLLRDLQSGASGGGARRRPASDSKLDGSYVGTQGAYVGTQGSYVVTQGTSDPGDPRPGREAGSDSESEREGAERRWRAVGVDSVRTPTVRTNHLVRPECFRVDVALMWPNGPSVAVEVEGGTSVLSDGSLSGHAVLKERLLTGLGWRMVHVSQRRWEELESESESESEEARRRLLLCAIGSRL